MENPDTFKILEEGRCCTLGETEFAYFGRNDKGEHIFSALSAKIFEPLPFGKVEIIALKPGSFISDGVEVIFSEKPDYRMERRDITEDERLLYFMADRQRLNPAKNSR